MQEKLSFSDERSPVQRGGEIGNQEWSGTGGGQRDHGLPAPSQGARLPGMNEPEETARRREGLSEGFHPEGVKAQRAKDPEAKR